uniref:RING-type E3 ubiquitin transferase n=1 Tax=Davidia involucrata TaxID=16924 RepID=A0A5B6YT66_DAVIN
MSFHHAFSVRQDNDIIPRHLPESYDCFFFRIRVSYMLEQPNHNLAVVNSFNQSVGIPRDLFVDDQDFVYLLLSSNFRIAKANLPPDIIEEIINQVSNFGESLMNDACNAHKVLAILVDIRNTTLQQPDENQDEAIDRVNRAIQEPRREEVIAFRPRPRPPAYKSPIQALEKTTLLDFDSSSLKECAICLEKLSVGLEIVGMPCSHIYHGDCIVRWLQRSNLCPLCRFPMPC